MNDAGVSEVNFARIQGFPPIGTPDARILILGSMPSVKSLEAKQYYAHKGNIFWRIMGELCGAGLDKQYSERVFILNEKKIAVWDVLQSCIRRGSGDLDIRDEQPNDFQTFFKLHPKINKIGLNGQKAADCFKRFNVVDAVPHATSVVLPSTSPANARLPFDQKRNAWRNLMFS